MVTLDDAAAIREDAYMFLDGGINQFEKRDYRRARVLLEAAGDLFKKIQDDIGLSFIRPWYRSTVEILPESLVQEKPPKFY